MDSIQVSIKIRPLIQREKDANLKSVWSVSDGNIMKSNNNEYELSFDHILDENATTQQLFDTAGKRIVSSALKGINGTIFAYGQTSSGKTYSMLGNDGEPGIVTLVVREIFKEIEASEDREFLLRIGYVEIYNEKIFDLLDKDKDDLKIHEANGEINIDQREVIAKSEQEILVHFDLGNKNKRMGETGMNEQSSRSHTIFRITIESREQGKNSEESAVQISNLNLVDLAGSERASQTKATGNRAKEGAFINKSLLFLSLVIQKLSESSESTSTEKMFINYRDSKLTRILQASLGGNALTSIICTITPATLDETYYTLTFAQRAKKIKNKPKVNEVMTDQVMMKRLEKEISRLRSQLISEQTKNSECLTTDIEKKIALRLNQFLHSHNVNNFEAIGRIDDKCRRRTWCQTSTIPVRTITFPKVIIAPPSLPSSLPLRRTTSPKLLICDNEWLDNEIFTPGEEFNLDKTLSPLGSKDDLNLVNLIRTPCFIRPRRSSLESPNPKLLETKDNLKARCNYLQLELEELNDFKKLEELICDNCWKMDIKLKNTNEQLTAAETAHFDLLEKYDDLVTQSNDLKSPIVPEIMLNDTPFDPNVAILNKRIEELEELLNSARQEVLSTQATLKEKSADALQIQKESDELSTQLIESIEEVDVCRVTIKNLEETLSKVMCAQEHEMTAEIADLKKGLTGLIAMEEENIRLKNVEKQHKKCDTKLKEMQDKVISNEALEMELRAKYDQIQVLETTVNENEIKIDELKLKMTTNQEESITKEREVVVKLEQELSLLQEEKLAADIRVLELEEEISNSNENNQKKIDELELKMFTNQEEFITNERDAVVKLQQLQDEKLAADLRVWELEEKTSILNEEHEKKIDEIKLKMSTNQLESIANENDEVVKLQQQLNVLQEEKMASDSRVWELEEKISILNEDYGKKMDEIKLKMSTNQEELIANENDVIVKLQQQLNILQEEKLVADSRVCELEEEISRSVERDVVDKFQQQLIVLQEEILAADIRVCELEEEISRSVGRDVVEKLQEQLTVLQEKKLAGELEEEISRSVGRDVAEKLQQQLNILQEEKQAADIRVCELEEEISRSVGRDIAEKLQQQLIVLQEEKMAADIRVCELEEEISRSVGLDVAEKLQQELNILQEEKQAADVRVWELEEKLSILNEDYLKKIDEFKLKMSTNQEKSTTNENDVIVKLQQQLNLLQEEKQAGDIRVCELEEEISRSVERDVVEKLQQQLIVLQEEKLAADIRVCELEEEISRSIGSDVTIKLQQQLIVLQEEKLAADIRVCELEEEISRSVGRDVVEKLQQQLIVLEEEKLAADIRVYEVEEEISNLNEDYQKKIDKIVTQKASDKEASLNSVNIAVLENDKLRMELSNVIEAQQKLLEIEANKYTQLVTETNEERLKSTVEMDEIVEKLNSTKCSLDDAKKAAMERDVAIQTLKSENTRLLLQNELNLNELNDKLKSLEAEIVENTTKLREIERKSSKLEDEVKNRDSMLMLKEDNIYSLKDELNNLKITMQERIDECAELKTRYRRRSCDGEKKVLILEAKNTELLQENGAIQARKLAVENELKKLKIECQHMLEQQIPQLVQDNQRMTSVINDHDFNYSLLDEKNCQLMKDNEKLTSLRDAEAMMKESLIKETESLQMELNCLNIKINEQLHSVNLVENAHLVKLQQMQNEIERLQSTENVAKASSNGSSRNGRSSLDDDLFLKQQILFEDRRNTPKRASIAKVERKNRRQSVHDDNRQLSVWEMFNDGECQTDPVDENCACAAMNEKIVKLSRDLRIKECQVQNYEKMSKINPLQLDVQELKKTLSREQKTHDDTRRELNETKRSIHKLQVQISDLERNQIVAVHKIEKSTQTLEEKNVEVSVKKDLEELEALNAQLEVMNKKYDMAKRLCNLRNHDLSVLRTNLEQKSDDYDTLMIKYGKVKVICQHRNEELKSFRENEMESRHNGLDVIIE